MNNYKVGDLLVTETGYETQVEICTFKGSTGSLFFNMTTKDLYHCERFVKNSDSLPYSTRVIRKENAKSFIDQCQLDVPA